MRFVLASASTSRLALLRSAGFDPEPIPSDFDESSVSEPSPGRLCRALAKAKAKAVAARLEGHALVLGCDSVLEFEGQTWGKPGDAEEAVRRWKQMRGRSGRLHTGHCLIDLPGGRRHLRSVATEVRFADITDAEIAAYVATGEPLRCAGGFTVDELGAPFVTGIDGDPGNVIGVSLPLLREMLTAWAIPVSSLWARDESASLSLIRQSLMP